MSEPLRLFVAPPSGRPQWWVLVDDDGANFVGDYNEATHIFPDDDTRHAGYRLGYGEMSSLWREASRLDCLLLVQEFASA